MKYLSFILLLFVAACSKDAAINPTAQVSDSSVSFSIKRAGGQWQDYLYSTLFIDQDPNPSGSQHWNVFFHADSQNGLFVQLDQSGNIQFASIAPEDNKGSFSIDGTSHVETKWSIAIKNGWLSGTVTGRAMNQNGLYDSIKNGSFNVHVK